MIDFLVSQPQYADHLLPIWFALPPEQRGTFWAVDKAAARVQPEVGDHFRRTYPTRKGDLVVVASHQDCQHVRRAGRRIVLVNHGTGQRYGGNLRNHPAYVGGSGQRDVELFIEPGPYAGKITREAGGNVVEVGCPKLDPIHRFPASPQEGVVAVSWHWHCVSGVPETDWAWPEYRDAVVELSKTVKVIGHAHPRAWLRMARWYREVGIEPVESFSEVLERASVFVADNTSALFEFASTGRPVVVLNSKFYRRAVSHGLRFWDLAPGKQVNHPDDLAAAIESVQLLSDYYEPEIRKVTEKVYHATDGKAAERAAQAILELGVDMDPYRPKRKAQIPPERKPDPPQFPLARLRRIGASSHEIQEARGVWDSMDSPEEQFAAAAEFAAMPDVALREALREQQEPINFDGLTANQVLEIVGSDKVKAHQALAAEGPDGRKTLRARLERIINA